MMDRERLIEIIEQAQREAKDTAGSMNGGFAAWYADKLIEAGVVFKVEKRPNNTVVIANIPEMVGDYLREYKKQKICSIGVIPAEHVGWIPVTDRVPEHDDIVLAFFPEMRGTECAIQIQKGWSVKLRFCSHWMPLPEEPKEVHDEKVGT